jgi:hypothetical protein
MTMGFKFQLVSCRSPQEVLTVTLTHLATVGRCTLNSFDP